MSRFSNPTTTRYKLRLAIVGASVTLVSALGSLGEAAKIDTLWLASCGVLIVGAASVLWLTVREHAAAAGQYRRDMLELLVTVGPNRIPRLEELSAYDLGTDPEALGSDGPTPYLPRDKDDELDQAIVRARRAGDPSMVVLRGPSKSGKSRTLYESAKRIGELRGAFVLAPRHRDALARLLDEGPPVPRRAQVVLWLDDLERFVSAGRDGMASATLDALRDWARPVVVLATAGGKGAELLSDGLSVPIRQLYGHRRVTVVSLSSDLTNAEAGRVRDVYASDAAQQIVAHGIGEYLVAAPELARKLDDERHSPGDERCPEGAAIAWAAIDWARSGMTGAIPDALLRELWPLYLRGIQPTDERFERGLDWALRPVYRSVALVYETSSYEAYDWIVAHASSRLTRQINARAWERMMHEVDPAAAFELAVAAHQKGSIDECRRAFERGTHAEDGLVAANSAFNLGYVLAEQGDVDGATAAYRIAIESSEPEPAAMAGLNLGILLQEHGDLNGAAAAYRGAMDRAAAPHSGSAALNLGLLLSRHGDVAGARDAFATAASEDDKKLASRAEFMLGTLLAEMQPAEAAEALGRAIALGDTEIAPAAGYLRDQLLAVRASAAYQVAAASNNHAPAPLAASSSDAPSAESAFNLALRLDEEGDVAGARRAYEHVIASGAEELVPPAAFSLAVLLGKHGEDDAARSAYEIAVESGHPRIAPAASFGLGSLLARRGDVDAARGALELAAAAEEEEDIAYAAAAALDQLPDPSMEGRR
jgi:tetratricopeptide (TPR) repeat protein